MVCRAFSNLKCLTHSVIATPRSPPPFSHQSTLLHLAIWTPLSSHHPNPARLLTSLNPSWLPKPTARRSFERILPDFSRLSLQFLLSLREITSFWIPEKTRCFHCLYNCSLHQQFHLDANGT